jgi:hypothetical protein
MNIEIRNQVYKRKGIYIKIGTDTWKREIRCRNKVIDRKIRGPI